MTRAEEIANARGGLPTKNGFLIRCPVPTHGKGQGDNRPSLFIGDRRDGSLYVKCYAGCTPESIFEALQIDAIVAPPITRPTLVRDTMDAALKIWNEAKAHEGTLVETYLRRRNLPLNIPEVAWVIRFHPRLWLDGRFVPAMLTKYVDIDTNEMCGVERTFLNLDGSKIERRSLGRTRKHAAVKLETGFETRDGRLVIGEGFETCVMAFERGFRPVWALGSADSIKYFRPLPQVDQLIILVEDDDAGRNAAEACAWQWRGRDVLFKDPPFGKDYADWRQK